MSDLNQTINHVLGVVEAHWSEPIQDLADPIEFDKGVNALKMGGHFDPVLDEIVAGAFNNTGYACMIPLEVFAYALKENQHE